jgi:hypothetical protein
MQWMVAIRGDSGAEIPLRSLLKTSFVTLRYLLHQIIGSHGC